MRCEKVSPLANLLDIEQTTPRLRKTGEFYELDGEPIRRVVGRPHTERDPFNVLWDLRESAIELLGANYLRTLILMNRFDERSEKVVCVEVRDVLVRG